jgi:hypothetical protein
VDRVCALTVQLPSTQCREYGDCNQTQSVVAIVGSGLDPYLSLFVDVGRIVATIS